MPDPDRSRPPTPTIQIVDQFQVSPPPGSVPTTTVPLTFLDVPWLFCRPMQRLFFYNLPTNCRTTLHFAQTLLPNLSSSLSLSLRRFFPLASSLVSPPPRGKPFILFTEGDSVPFTLAESTLPNSFDRLLTDQPMDVKDLHPYVPDLPPVRAGQDGGHVVPLLAVQVTVFPGSGVCIGVQFRHVAADGMAFNQFMKFWAEASRTGGRGVVGVSSDGPCLDRKLVRDPRGLGPILLEEWWKCASAWDHNFSSTTDQAFENKVRATFVINREQINRLKDFIGIRFSTFVVTCAFIWVSMIKSKENRTGFDHSHDKQSMCNFGFVADCRHRLEQKLPETYFGNCLDICLVSVKKSDILGEHGLVVASNAIGDRVKQLENGVFEGAETWMQDWQEMEEQGGLVTVAGSPKLRVYDTDFGWGRPEKIELVQIDVSGAIYICESRDGDDGVEIGLALVTMDLFSSNVKQLLEQI